MLHRVAPGRARRLLLCVLLALGVAVGLSACEPPVTPDNRPTTVAGQTNGQLPASLLFTISADCQVHTRVAPSMLRMIADAKADGVVLRGLSCYRDYAGQVSAREYWCGQGSCGRAAVPGTSNHGWGKAVDFTGAGGTFGFDSPGYQWMAANAWRYGWNHPDWAREGQPNDEPWHWEWVGDGGTKYPGTTVGPQDFWSVGPPGPVTFTGGS